MSNRPNYSSNTVEPAAGHDHDPLAPMDRTSRGLREMLFDEIDRLRSGKSDVSTAKAVAALAGQVINVVHMEISVAQLRKNYPGDTKLVVPAPLRLDGPGV